MKKVTNISIGERVFSIEEDAFAILNKYLSEVGEYFEKQESDEEILKDIEYSIAEKLDNKKRSLENAVNIGDVDSIISELGTLEELTDGDVNTPAAPEKKDKKKKRLYRDGEDKVIAGVASGIANYFGIDPVIIRVAFVVFVFMSGAGIVLYLILWVIVPVAKTASQKLAMRGESANLESISDFFEEKVKKKSTKNILIKIISFPFVVLGMLFGALKKVIPVVRVIIGIGITIIISVFIFILCSVFLIIASGGAGFNVDALTLEIFAQIKNMSNYILIYWSAFSIIFIPLFLSLIGGIYLIFKTKMMGVNVFVVLFIFWIASLSFFTINVAENTETIGNIAEKLGEHSINEGEEFEIKIDL